MPPFSRCSVLNYNHHRTIVPAKRIPISEIRKAPIRHEHLPVALVTRIGELQQALAEVYPKPIENWLDEFKRDTDPEAEVDWWESLVAGYRAYTEPKDLTLSQKKAAFKIFLLGGMGEDLRSLAAEFACLPEGSQAEVSAMMGPRPN
jgi:hypothetical protein